MAEVLEKTRGVERTGQPPTIQDVARALGMHKSTVSFALSGKGTLAAGTRDHIISVARQMGYEPNPLAQRLASGHRNQAVCIVTGILDMGLATEKILLIQRELVGHGLEIPIYTCPYGPADSRTQADQVRQICRQRPRAVVCASQLIADNVFDELELYQAAGGVVISYDSVVPLACDQVIFDRENNANQAARYLLERGHRKLGIAMSSKVDWVASGSSFAQPDRMAGFIRALGEFGATFRPDFVFKLGAYELGGKELAEKFLALDERPTALCIVNDYVALAFMVEVMRKGVRIPHDLSIVGHDNQLVASYCPVPLTSSSQPAEEIARSVVKLLLDRLNGSDDEPRNIIIRGQMVERDSVSS